MDALVESSEWLAALALSLDNYDAFTTAFRESLDAAEKKAKAAAAKGIECTLTSPPRRSSPFVPVVALALSLCSVGLLFLEHLSLQL